ncbi:MAG: 1-acyl-sn-glycerol-3-phosphate acyltransferase [Desulfobulbaceae bacterium]|nr:1-acyl-sn-glycerol-3-phosphate acyltransferase [Desulfobulbaceae bacterium]
MLNIMNYILVIVIRLRYSVKVKGLEGIRLDGRPLLFLPNHPALIDPLIVMSILYVKFRPRPLASEGQVNRLGLRRLMKIIRAVVIPDSTTGVRKSKEQIVLGLRKIVEGLRQGDNVLLYPAGRLMRSGKEDIGANSAVEYVLREVPDVRVVLLRTTGLWGSSFSRAFGTPSLVRQGWVNVGRLLLNFLLFMPRRKVTVEVYEPAYAPLKGTRLEVNGYLEEFYNACGQVSSVVPYYWWRKAGVGVVPRTHHGGVMCDISDIPQATAALVLDKLIELSGEVDIHGKQHLAKDLGLDSLAMVEFVSWLGNEFGVTVVELERLKTVADCILAACCRWHYAIPSLDHD